MTDIRLDGARILVVDDEPANVLLLDRLLTGVGAERVATTCNPQEAVDLYQQVRPDLVLLDLHMPGMDGIAVMAALAAVAGWDDFVPVVILTADSTAPARERALAAGASDFLIKPFDRTEVLLRARNLLYARAMHNRVVANNVGLQAELDRRQAADEVVRSRREAKLTRVTSVLDAGGPRMVFQPVVHLASGAVISYEALSRFDAEPSRTPDLWFAEAAEVGMGEALEISAVAAALRSLSDVPSSLPIGINVSPSTAISPRLRELLGCYPGERIILEITEHVPVADYDELLPALRGFRERGVQVAVDDAGAGFAGLQHILRLSPEIIKLDIALTRDIDVDAAKRSLGAAMVAFAAEIGSTIVAEGIETEQELVALQQLGVAAGQGYLLARPAPLEELLVPH
jgi:EAL domain-containing protein (putative c-di-GMP-specific phosphodiesterase class I)/ActR/RegA family two-component response regulator